MIGEIYSIESNRTIDIELDTLELIRLVDLPGEYTILEGDEYHTMCEGETIKSICFTKYNEREELWWYIADINNIVDPYEDLVGLQLLFPSYENIKKLIV